ncbi:MAG: GEVED domain-containing protein [Rhizobiaceae bacterium]|nr:GEVED domain-containing protein [Rhizobiaceae bacterium]
MNFVFAVQAQAQVPDLDWVATVVQVDCSGTSFFSPDTFSDSPPCQVFGDDLYENWDPDGTEPGMADLQSCDAAFTGGFYYQRWDVRDDWNDAGAHRFYIELELDRFVGGDNIPDIFVEYAPQAEHIGRDWNAEGNSQILFFENVDNLYGQPTPLAPDQANGSTSDSYSVQVNVAQNLAFARVDNGNLEIALSQTLIEQFVGIANLTQPPVSLRCWVAQTTSISPDSVPVHDYFSPSDLTGFRIDNNVGVSVSNAPTVGGVDYSDAPVITYGEASHLIDGAIYIGNLAPDPELEALQDIDGGVNADGDDLTNIDDEDGLVFPVLVQGEEVTLSVAATGAGGLLNAWIDWNGSGVFDANEQVALDLPDGGAQDINANAGVIDFVTTVPNDAVISLTYARFRWSTSSGLTPVNQAPDGEVEDFSLTVLEGMPSITVTKTASADGFTAGNILEAPVGTVITYTYVVRNNGNQTIRQLTLGDVHNGSGPFDDPGTETLTNDVVPLLDSTDASTDGIWDKLAPNDEVTFTTTYTITQSDIETLQ